MRKFAVRRTLGVYSRIQVLIDRGSGQTRFPAVSNCQVGPDYFRSNCEMSDFGVLFTLKIKSSKDAMRFKSEAISSTKLWN